MNLPAIVPAPRPLATGHVRVGDDVDIEFPLHNQRAQRQERIEIHFSGTGVRIEPQDIRIDSLGPGERRDIKTKAKILPLNGHRTAFVWAALSIDGRFVGESRRVEIPIFARPEMDMKFRLIAGGMAFDIRNDGDVSGDYALDVHANELRLTDDTLTLNQVGTDSWEISGITLSARSARTIEVQGTMISKAVLRELGGGDRDVAQFATREDQRAAAIDVDLELSPNQDGVRTGDIVPARLRIKNTGDVAVDRTIILELGTRITALDAWTLDGGRVVPVAQKGSLLFETRVPPGEVVLSGMLQVDRADPDSLDDLWVQTRVDAHGATTQRVGLSIDERPNLVPSSTYLSEIRPGEAEGLYEATLVIKHGDERPLEDVFVVLEADGLAPIDAIDENDDILAFQPTMLEGKPRTILDLQTLGPRALRQIVLRFRALQDEEEEGTIGVRARLIVNAWTCDLGTRSLQIRRRPKLERSALRLVDERPLRLTLPIELVLCVRNDGDAPARNVRLDLDLPPWVSIGLPEPKEGHWRMIAAYLPPGGVVEQRIPLTLVDIPQDDTLVLKPRIDADDMRATTLIPVMIPTPTSSRIDAPRLGLEVLGEGLIRVTGRIQNRGDGVAQDVALYASGTGRFVPQSTAVDDVAVPDIEGTSALRAGLEIGSLPPGRYRTVSWTLTVVDDEEPIAATLTIKQKAGREKVTRSAPMRPPMSPVLGAIDGSLPEARSIDDADAQSMDRGATVRVVPEEQRGLERSDVRNALTTEVATEVAATTSAAATDGGNGVGTQASLPSLQTELIAPVPVEVAPIDTKVDERSDELDTELAPEKPAEDAEDDDTDAVTLPDEHVGIPISQLDGARLNRARAVLPMLVNANGMGCWKHILATRVLLAEDVPGNDVARDFYKQAVTIIEQPTIDAITRLALDSFYATDEWIGQVCERDPDARKAIESYFDAIDGQVFGIYSGRIAPNGTLEALLPLFLPQATGEPGLDAALAKYHEELLRVFSQPDLLELTPRERANIYTDAHPMLDDALNDVMAEMVS